MHLRPIYESPQDTLLRPEQQSPDVGRTAALGNLHMNAVGQGAVIGLTLVQATFLLLLSVLVFILVNVWLVLFSRGCNRLVLEM